MFNFDSFKSAFNVGVIIGGALKEQVSVVCEKSANVCYDAGDCLMDKAVTLHEEANKRRKEAGLEEYSRTITPRNTVVEKEVIKEVIKEVKVTDPDLEKKLAEKEAQFSVIKQNWASYRMEAEAKEEALRKEVNQYKNSSETWQSKHDVLLNENIELRKEVKEQGAKINTLEDRMNMIIQKLEKDASAPAPEPKKSPKKETAKKETRETPKRTRMSTGVYDTVEEAAAAKFEEVHSENLTEMDELDALLNNAVETDSI